MICDYYDPEFEVGFQVIDGASYIVSNDNGRTLISDGTSDEDDDRTVLSPQLRSWLEPGPPVPESDDGDSSIDPEDADEIAYEEALGVMDANVIIHTYSVRHDLQDALDGCQRLRRLHLRGDTS